MMCCEVQSEGAFDEGNARASCSESSTSTKEVTSGVMWKARATNALAAHKYSAFQYMVFFNVSIWSLQWKLNISIWPLQWKYSTFSIWLVMLEISYFQ